MHIDLLSLFPDYFTSPMEASILKRAIDRKFITVRRIDIRDYAEGKHRKVDDRPAGGGPGMVMMPGPVIRAIRDARTTSKTGRVVYLSPQGKKLTSDYCRELANAEHLIFLCGHYEGVDQRALDLEVDEEISIGDYVLTNGCLAALVVLDAVIRFIPGVLGNEEAADQDTFSRTKEGGVPYFEGPHYTKPHECEGLQIPEVLLSGNHKKIEAWRNEQALRKMEMCRQDLATKIVEAGQNLR